MSMESRDIQEYNALYRSLREVLLPANLWFKRVSQFESVPGLTLEDVGGENSIWKSPNYLVPYTYTHPMVVEMLHEKQPNTRFLNINDARMFTERDVQEWVTRVKYRMNPYIEGVVSDELVSEFDNNSDIGVIIHKTGGCIFPFSYTEVKDFMFQMIPEQTIMLCARYALAHTDDPEMYQDLSGLVRRCHEHAQQNQEPEYYMYYTPIMKDGKQSTACGTFTWQDTIPIKDTHELTKYMRLMFINHAKCLVVP